VSCLKSFRLKQKLVKSLLEMNKGKPSSSSRISYCVRLQTCASKYFDQIYKKSNMFVQNMMQAQNYERMTTGKHVHVMVRVCSMKNIHMYMYVYKRVYTIDVVRYVYK